MGNITLKELAQKLGLAVSTVSKALNDSYEISASTKLKVKEMAGLYNYKPNVLAQSLKTGKTNTLAVVIPYLSNSFQSQLLEGAQQAAYVKNYKLIFMQSRENAEIEKESLDFLRQQNVDGIVITPSASTDVDFLKKFNERTPIVLVDRIDLDVDTHKIGLQNEEGAFLATQHLLDNGLTDILVLCGHNIAISEKRVLGYKKALLANNMMYDSQNIIKVDYGQSKENLLKSLSIILKSKLQGKTNSVGILGTTDTLTVSVLGILHNLKYKVPEQVAVIGFANSSNVESMNPPLSTVFQPAFDIGYQGVIKLIELIESKSRFQTNFETILLPSELIIRESSV